MLLRDWDRGAFLGPGLAFFFNDWSINESPERLLNELVYNTSHSSTASAFSSQSHRLGFKVTSRHSIFLNFFFTDAMWPRFEHYLFYDRLTVSS